MSGYKYKELTPNDNIENGDAYFEALKQAFENNKIKNIALAGPYGSGKSSIIQSFLKKTETEGFCKRESIKSKSLIISMATFLKANDNKNDKKITKDDEDKIIIDANEVEKGILKQLFYKVDPSKIPQSRYRKLHKISFWRTFLYVFLAFTIMLIFMYAFDTKLFLSLSNKIDSIFVVNNLALTLLKYAIFNFIISFLITLFIKEVACKIHIKEIKLPINATFDTQIDNETIFNKNLDEIVYFFEETDYRIIFFEDLDRLEDPKIFIHLRELNNLLNNNDAIKNKPVVFVYAVRDDIFSNNDRTKFFDFIIPVIPVVNSTNSSEILIKEFNIARKNEYKCKISEEFLLDVSSYITDMRILQNILNEFATYKDILLNSDELPLSDEKLFSIILFKNIYPKEFADIQNESGIIKKVFDKKDIFIDNKKKEIKSNIDNYSDMVTLAQKDVSKTILELKYVMLASMLGGLFEVECFTVDNSSYSNKLPYSEFIKDDFDMKRLLDEKYLYIRYKRDDYDHRYIKIDDNVLLSFIKRWNALKTINDEKMIKTQDDLEKLKKEFRNLSKLNISDVLNNYSTVFLEMLDDDIKSNKLLLFLLRRKYLDENYYLYINYFFEESITKKDMDYVLGVKNLTSKDFGYKLNKKSRVIRYLNDSYFEEKAIYNFDLLEQLLREEKSTKLSTFISQLLDSSNDSLKFIDEFIDKESENDEVLKKFILQLTDKSDDMLNNILNAYKLDYLKQFKYIKLIISYCDIDTIVKQNVDDCIRKIFEDNEDILIKLKECDSNKLNLIIKALQIKFKILSITDVDKTLLEHIFDNNCYEINDKMLENLLSFKKPAFLKDYVSKPYSTILKLGFDPCVEYIRDNVKIFINGVIFRRKNVADNLLDIVEMIKLLKGNRDLQIKLIQIEKIHLNDLSKFAGDLVLDDKDEWLPIWNCLLEKKNSIVIKWENIQEYWVKFGFTKELSAFINHHIMELKNKSTKMLNDNFIKDFIIADIEILAFNLLLPKMKLKKFDFDISEIPTPKLEAMLNCNYFEFTVSRFEDIKNISDDLTRIFIINNQTEYMDSIENAKLSSTLFESLLFDNNFSQDNKEILFKKYAKAYMNHNIALNMKKFKKLVNNEIFDLAWNNVDADESMILLAEYADCLNNDEIEDYLYSLEAPYSELSNRNEEHEVILLNTKNNRLLAESLKKVSYISGYKEKKCTYEYSKKEKLEECLVLIVNDRNE